jgi:hypothetical protein
MATTDRRNAEFGRKTRIVAQERQNGEAVIVSAFRIVEQ